MLKTYAVPALVASGNVVQETLGIGSLSPAEVTNDYKFGAAGSVGFHL